MAGRRVHRGPVNVEHRGVEVRMYRSYGESRQLAWDGTLRAHASPEPNKRKTNVCGQLLRRGYSAPAGDGMAGDGGGERPASAMRSGH